MTDTLILQPTDLLKKLNIKNEEDGMKILNLFVSFFAYMKTGDQLETSLVSFHKVDEDLFHIDVHIDAEEIVDTLHKSRVIRIPI
jgi:hypothetical protein